MRGAGGSNPLVPIFSFKEDFMKRKILITNDDSIFAEGIKRLEQGLKEFGSVYTVAPDREKSAVSFGITTNSPLRISRVDEFHYAISGTPVDCVYLATKVLLKEKPDIVISGINHGANIGEDTIYSGTVAGAFQASLLGIQAIAVSVIENKDNIYDFESAIKVSKSIVKFLLNNPLPEGTILSINVPFKPKGVKLTKLGHKRYDAEVIEKMDPRGNKYYWIGPGKITVFGEDSTDVKAVESGYISVTPLSLNFFNDELYGFLKEKENEIFKEMV